MENNKAETASKTKDVLDNIRKKYPEGDRRFKSIKKSVAFMTIIGLALAFYSSTFHLPGQIYNNTDRQVAIAANNEPLSGAQSELLTEVDQTIVNSIFEPVFIYENGSVYRGGTAFAIEELNEVDENFRCITTLMQSHGELNSHKMNKINVRLPGSDHDIESFTFISKNYPYEKDLYGSGWDFVALCFEDKSIGQTSKLTFVGNDAFSEYKPNPKQKLITIGLPGILNEGDTPNLFLSEHVPYTNELIVGGQGAQGESGGIVLSRPDNKIVGTILRGPELKNTLGIQSITNINQFKTWYEEFKNEAIKLWTGGVN